MKMIYCAFLAAALVFAASPRTPAAARASTMSMTAVCAGGFHANPDTYTQSELNSGRTFKYTCSKDLGPHERHRPVTMRCSPGFSPGGIKYSKRRVLYVCTWHRNSR